MSYYLWKTSNKTSCTKTIMERLVIYILLVLTFSCRQKENVETNINNYTNAVLASSRFTTEYYIRGSIGSLLKKLKAPQTRDSALVYRPKAHLAYKLGRNMSYYLEALNDKINNNQHLGDKDSLFEKLKTYETEIMNVDTLFFEDFGNTILFIDTLNGFKGMNREQFNKQFINGSSKNDCITFLNSLKENILIVIATMVHYFDLKCNSSSFYKRYYLNKNPMASFAISDSSSFGVAINTSVYKFPFFSSIKPSSG